MLLVRRRLVLSASICHNAVIISVCMSAFPIVASSCYDLRTLFHVIFLHVVSFFYFILSPSLYPNIFVLFFLYPNPLSSYLHSQPASVNPTHIILTYSPPPSQSNPFVTIISYAQYYCPKHPLTLLTF